MNQIDRMIEAEWNQFQKVENEGGRASCQDDFVTFQIMRESQFVTWTEELQVSYFYDLQKAEDSGRNLIFEKYMRMMESTAPLQYQELLLQVPIVIHDEERIRNMEEVIGIQVNWTEDFAKRYPRLINNGRYIHTSEDQPYETSSETYLRGELATYSDQTMNLYQVFILNLKFHKQNLAEMITTHMVKRYGYASLEAANASL